MTPNNMFIGHQIQWQFLKRIAQTGKIPQALLFSGQKHLAKMTVAKEFIKLLNCQKPQEGEPCQKCFSCQSIAKERYPDLTMVRPQKDVIQISQIRGLQNILNLGSQISSIKAVIIERAEKMNKDAQNCLLKTLEEPRGKTLLILVSCQPEMLTETIISRTQLLKFYPLEPPEIRRYFKGKVDDDFLEKLVFLSAGLPGKAREFFENGEKLEKEIDIFRFWQKLLTAELPQRFYYLNQFFSKKEKIPVGNLETLLEILLKYLREGLLEKLGLKRKPPKSLLGFFKIFRNYSVAYLKRTIDSCENLRLLISQTNINPKLALENFTLFL